MPDMKRPFRTPAATLVGLGAIGGCAYLFISLPVKTILACLIWNAIGLAVYFLYGRRRAALGAA
jgi:APA family basic amino acid/polyamine antiporter